MGSKDTFFKMYRESVNPIFIESNQADPAMQFQLGCEKEYVAPLPALTRIKDNTLSLCGYSLNRGLCKALEQSLQKVSGLRKIILERNSLVDDMLSFIIKGIAHTKTMRSICIYHNEVGPKSCEALQSFLEKTLQLEELRLNSCRMNTIFVNEILSQIKKRPNCIRMLSLARANLNDISLRLISEIMNVSTSLIELDISWNNVKKQARFAFIKDLEYNQRLQYLNLSFITMSDLSKQGE